MSRESAKAKYTRLPGDPEVGYISPDDVMDAIDIMYDDMTNGPVVDADVAADANIGRSKIAGTALTADSMGVFSVKDYGAVGDGETDDTDAIQAAVDAASAAGGGTVYVPAGRHMIKAHVAGGGGSDHNLGGVALDDDIRLVMDPNATLAAIPNVETTYYVLRVYKKARVTIMGGSIEGDRDDHTGTTGEWGIGISVLGSTDVTIQDVHISDCWGDGILVGMADDLTVPERIVVDRVTCDGNRRQGMSVTSVRRMHVTRSRFVNTSGTAPEAGIDFEPNAPSHPIEDVVVDGCELTGNDGAGLQLSGASSDNITVRDCVIAGNAGGYGAAQVYQIEAVTGFRLVDNRISTPTPATTGCVALAGGSDYVVSGNHMDGGFSAGLLSRITIRDNVFVARESASPPIWMNLGGMSDALIDGNLFDSLADQAAEHYGIYASNIVRHRFVNNRIVGCGRGASIESTGSEDIAVVGNAFDNNGRWGLYISGAKQVVARGNVFAGSCGLRDGFYCLGVSTTTFKGYDNLFVKDPRYSGAGAGRATVGLRLLGGTTDAQIKGNRSVGSGLSAWGRDSYPTTGYHGDERGLMVAGTSDRPSAPVEGMALYDTTINKHITFNGTVWKDGADNTV